MCIQGRNVLQGLISAARDHKIKLRIVNNFARVPSSDVVDLVRAGGISSLFVEISCGDVMVRSSHSHLTGHRFNIL